MISYFFERKYIVDVLINDFLGINQLQVSIGSCNCVINCPNRKKLVIEDHFFSRQDEQKGYIAPKNIPAEVCYTKNQFTPEPDIPVIHGTDLLEVNEDGIMCGIDIFASSFFMLTRWEEIADATRDEHDRFPAMASLAYRFGFLDRPVVNEYVEMLWNMLKHLDPTLERKPRKPRTLVSCDVDMPFDPAGGSLAKMLRRVGAKLLRDRSPMGAIRAILNYGFSHFGDCRFDEYRSAIDWIMDVNDAAGNKVAFYFIPLDTSMQYDLAADIAAPRIRKLLRHVHDRGHEIGIHPGYCTYDRPENFARSIHLLRQIMAEEGIEQQTLGGRQHFLRWQSGTTEQLWEANNLDYDSTLSYADHPGFRCGVCYEYPMYDLAARKPMRLRQRPLIVMECTVIADRYMGLGYSPEALELMKGYRGKCRRFNGDFTLLWHNSHFSCEDDKEFYVEILS